MAEMYGMMMEGFSSNPVYTGMMMEGFSSNPVYTGSCYSMG